MSFARLRACVMRACAFERKRTRLFYRGQAKVSIQSIQRDLMAVSEQRWTGAALKWPGAGEYAHEQHPPHVQLPSSQREH